MDILDSRCLWNIQVEIASVHVSELGCRMRFRKPSLYSGDSLRKRTVMREELKAEDGTPKSSKLLTMAGEDGQALTVHSKREYGSSAVVETESVFQ